MDVHAKVIPLRLHPLGFIEAFIRVGASLDGLLRDTGIAKHHLDHRTARISYFQQSTLIRNGVNLCRRPGLGLAIAQHFDFSFYGTAGQVIHCSPTLREAADVFRRHMMIAQPYYAMSARRPDTYVDENSRLVYPLQCFPADEHCPQAMLEFEHDYRLATTLRFWDECGNKSVADPSVHVALRVPEPPHADLYRALPCTSVKFGCAQSQLSAHIDFVMVPFRPFRKLCFDNLVQRCEAELREAKLAMTLTAKVRWHLFEHFEKHMSLERTADMLRMTPRALTRALALEKTSFRNVFHDVRMELTSYHLRESKLSVDQISELMGFSSTSSLRRAIRNWSGLTAGSVRSASPAEAHSEPRVA